MDGFGRGARHWAAREEARADHVTLKPLSRVKTFHVIGLEQWVECTVPLPLALVRTDPLSEAPV